MLPLNVFNHCPADKRAPPASGAEPGYVPIDHLSLQAWRNVMDGGVAPAFLVAQAAFQLMRAQSPAGGRIINVHGHAPRRGAGSAAHVAARHALTGLTNALVFEGKALRIACCQIEPDADIADEADAAREVANAAHYMAGLPLTANVQKVAVMN